MAAAPRTVGRPVFGAGRPPAPPCASTLEKPRSARAWRAARMASRESRFGSEIQGSTPLPQVGPPRAVVPGAQAGSPSCRGCSTTPGACQDGTARGLRLQVLEVAGVDPGDGEADGETERLGQPGRSRPPARVDSPGRRQRFRWHYDRHKTRGSGGPRRECSRRRWDRRPRRSSA